MDKPAQVNGLQKIKDDQKISLQWDFAEANPEAHDARQEKSQRLWLSEMLMETPDMGKLETCDFLQQQK